MTNASSRILFGCTIEGCVNPVVLSINSVVKDLMVTAHVSKSLEFRSKLDDYNKSEDNAQFNYMLERINDMGAPLDLIKQIAALDEFYPPNQTVPIVDFGRDCPINSQNSFTLVFRNHTAMSTYLDLAAENLGTDNADSLHALLTGDMAALASQTETAEPSANESERMEKIQLVLLFQYIYAYFRKNLCLLHRGFLLECHQGHQKHQGQLGVYKVEVLSHPIQSLEVCII